MACAFATDVAWFTSATTGNREALVLRLHWVADAFATDVTLGVISATATAGNGEALVLRLHWVANAFATDVALGIISATTAKNVESGG